MAGLDRIVIAARGPPAEPVDPVLSNLSAVGVVHRLPPAGPCRQKKRGLEAPSAKAGRKGPLSPFRLNMSVLQDSAASIASSSAKM